MLARLLDLGVEVLDGLVVRPAALDAALQLVMPCHLLGKVGLHPGQRRPTAKPLFRVQGVAVPWHHIGHQMRRRLVAVDRPADYVLLAVTLAEPGQRLGEVAVNKGPIPALEPLRGRAHEVLDAENGILPPLVRQSFLERLQHLCGGGVAVLVLVCPAGVGVRRLAGPVGMAKARGDVAKRLEFGGAQDGEVCGHG